MKTSSTLIGGMGLALAGLPQAALAQSAQNTEKKEAASSSSSGSFRMSTGISFSRGDYGETQKTKVLAVPVSATYRKGGLKIRVSAPFVHIDGPGSLIQTPEGRDSGSGGRSNDSGSNSGSGSSNSGSGSSGSSGGSGSSNDIEVEDELDDDIIDDDGVVVGSGGVGLTRNKRSGIGDVNVALTYSFDFGSGFYFEPTAKVKLPTASKRKRLGTGEIDLTMSADLVKDVGNASFYVHGRRKFAGKPNGSSIRSTWGAGGGASVRAGEDITIGADYDWQQSAFAGRKASSEVSGWTNLRLNRRTSLTLYAGTGLNANSADFTGGLSISYRF